jgi:hypothetical protein
MPAFASAAAISAGQATSSVQSSVTSRLKPRRNGAEDADRLLGDLEAVAHRAEAEESPGEEIAPALDVGHVVDDAGGEDHAARGRRLAVRGGGHEQPIVALAQIDDLAVLDLDAVADRVRLEPAEDLVALDAVWEAREVVALGDQRGSARARIDDLGAAAEAREIDRGGEPRGPAADDQAIELGVGVRHVGTSRNAVGAAS